MGNINKNLRTLLCTEVRVVDLIRLYFPNYIVIAPEPLIFQYYLAAVYCHTILRIKVSNMGIVRDKSFSKSIIGPFERIKLSVIFVRYS